MTETVPAKQRKSTETSSFGTSGRFNHDSSKFYNSRLYKQHAKAEEILDYTENPIPNENLNHIFNKSSENMAELPDNSTAMMITSPPYNVGKDYDEDLSLQEYRNLLKRVFTETYRVLVPGGRACINIANIGRKPYIPLHSYIIEDMANLGFLMRGEIIWDKGAGSVSTAWGSWLKANNPVLRDKHEYILIFCKGSYSYKNPNKKQSTITKEEFLEYTKSIWTFSPARASSIGHPAPFPVELPRRLIKLYSFEGDAILDPFNGAGSTCVAAKECNRNYIGYDLSAEYCELANNRIHGNLF